MGEHLRIAEQMSELESGEFLATFMRVDWKYQKFKIYLMMLLVTK